MADIMDRRSEPNIYQLHVLRTGIIIATYILLAAINSYLIGNLGNTMTLDHVLVLLLLSYLSPDLYGSRPLFVLGT